MSSGSLREFLTLLDQRDAARERHEDYCASVNEKRAWCVLTTGIAERLHKAYLALQEQVDAALAEELEQS